jgi:hypothetical protein
VASPRCVHRRASRSRLSHSGRKPYGRTPRRARAWGRRGSKAVCHRARDRRSVVARPANVASRFGDPFPGSERLDGRGPYAARLAQHDWAKRRCTRRTGLRSTTRRDDIRLRRIRHRSVLGTRTRGNKYARRNHGASSPRGNSRIRWSRCVLEGVGLLEVRTRDGLQRWTIHRVMRSAGWPAAPRRATAADSAEFRNVGGGHQEDRSRIGRGPETTCEPAPLSRDPRGEVSRRDHNPVKGAAATAPAGRAGARPALTTGGRFYGQQHMPGQRRAIEFGRRYRGS